MKKIIKFLLVLALLLSSGYAIAGSSEVLKLIGLGLPPEVASQIDSQYSSAVTASTVPNADNSISLGSASKEFKNVFVGTTVTYGTSAQAVYPVAGVITPNTTFPTPVGATTPTPGYELTLQTYSVATAAPTAAYLQLPLATAMPGSVVRKVWNRGANPVAIVAQGSDTVNNSAAATAYSCATGKLCSCQLATTGSNGPWICVSQ